MARPAVLKSSRSPQPLTSHLTMSDFVHLRHFSFPIVLVDNENPSPFQVVLLLPR